MIGQTERTKQKNNRQNVQPLSGNGGLTPEEVAASRQKYGSNELTRRAGKTFLRRFAENFRDPIIRILIGALVLNTFLSIRDINWPENIGIAVAVLTATLVSTISEAGSERAFEKLSSEEDGKTVRARRGGTISAISVAEIVVGDRLLLTPGIRLPADGILLSGKLRVDQAALTGESDPVPKTPGVGIVPSPETYEADLHAADQLFRGSLITEGEGEMLVMRVGDGTFYGHIAAELQTEEAPSPLRERLRVLAGNVSRIGYVAAALIGLACLLKSFIFDAGFDAAQILTRLRDVRFVAAELLGALTVAVSVIVVAVPEGLPMMITVVLSSNMKKMLKSGVLVRRLVGIETAGSMNVLFTDKTGTLTSGKMHVTSIITGDGVYPNAERLRETPLAAEMIRNCALLCRSGGHNPTEEAIAALYGKREKSTAVLLEKLPFDSSRRIAAVRYHSHGEDVTVFRTSPEKLFQSASHYIAADGRRRPLTPNVMTHLNKEWRESAADACRVVGVGCTERTIDEIASGDLGDAAVVALFRIRDEIRAEVPAAVREAQEAGIQVIMMTGDNEVTAEAIARRCGIIRGRRGLVLTGTEIAALSDREIAEKLPSLAVVARAVPADKSRLIRISQEMGLVAGMTGDGINDAPALKAADVGFAMGSGTDVAREAGDIIITDDNFASIVKAVLYGRTIFGSIRKFILFQLTMNLSAVAVSLIGPFIGIEQPVTVIQMLWINMIMDTLGGLAFAGEPAIRSVMKRPPIKRTEPILTREMEMRIFSAAAYTVALCLYFLKAPRMRVLFPGDEMRMLTVFFALFVFCGIFNSFNARTDRLRPLANLGKNKPFLLIMTAVAAIQLALIYFGGETFRTVPLTMREIGLTALLASTVLPADGIIRLLLRIFRKKRQES